jgi:hypothetical protein
MKYQKAIDLYANNSANTLALISGQLKIQRGQWVKCGEGPCSRYVGIRNGVLWIAHPGRESVNSRFSKLTSTLRRRGDA